MKRLLIIPLFLMISNSAFAISNLPSKIYCEIQSSHGISHPKTILLEVTDDQNSQDILISVFSISATRLLVTPLERDLPIGKHQSEKIIGYSYTSHRSSQKPYKITLKISDSFNEILLQGDNGLEIVGVNCR